MNLLRTVLLLLCAGAAFAKDSPRTCSQCAEWNQPQTPFRIFGNTYYVGPHGLSSVLVTSDAGHVLIDGALPESAQQIAANIRTLGFRVEDVKLIVNSHVHFDHAGGIADLQRMTGARVLASSWSAAVMRRGGVGRSDPQFGSIRSIAKISNVHEAKDGETFKIGAIALTMHLTPGHTPGGTSWTWESCEAGVCHEMVYADSLSPVASDGFRFSKSTTYPHVLQDFEKSFAFLDTTRCDILITPHPELSDLWDRLSARDSGINKDSMVNPSACRHLADQSRMRLRQRLDQEQSKNTP